jgi:hypothetical protein
MYRNEQYDGLKLILWHALDGQLLAYLRKVARLRPRPTMAPRIGG